MEIHPTGCLPYGNELLLRGSTNVSIKKWSFSSERGQMVFPPCEGLVFQHKLPLQWRGGGGNHLLITAPLAESTFWEQKGLDGVFLHQSQTEKRNHRTVLVNGRKIYIKKIPTGTGWFFPTLHRTAWIKARASFLRRWNTNTRRIKWQFLHVPELWIRKIVSAALINGNFKEKHGPSITLPPNYILLLRTAFYVPSRLPKNEGAGF